MKLGFTATRTGLTDAQLATLRRLLVALAPTELHHGDCVGGDEDGHNTATSLKLKTVGHPPNIAKLRAYCLTDLALPPAPYLERNKVIVDVTDALLACPRAHVEEQRSGTWATIRYARQQRKPVEIIWPDGSVTLEEPCQEKGAGK